MENKNQGLDQEFKNTINTAESKTSSWFFKVVIIVVAALIIGCGAILYTRWRSVPALPVSPIADQDDKIDRVQAASSVCGNGEIEIKFISKQSGPAGTRIEMEGCGFSGFENDKDVWIENAKGEKGIIHGDFAASTNERILFQLASPVCAMNIAYKGGPCPQWMELAPGTYKIYTEPWGKRSNEIRFTITPSAGLAQAALVGWKQYMNSQYAIEFKYPQSWLLKENIDNKNKKLWLLFKNPESVNYGSPAANMFPVTVIVYLNHPAANQPLRTWVEREQVRVNMGIPKEKLNSIENLSVGGREAYMYQGQISDGSDTPIDVFIKNKGQIIQASFGVDQENSSTVNFRDVMDTMLSTFKFINIGNE